VHTGLVVTLWKTEGAKIFLLSLIVLLLCTVVTGSGMAFFAIPPYLQPLHLLFATLTFGAQYMFFLKIDRKDFNVAVGS
jgi:cytochrome c oxidase assembly protein subunit 15